MAIFGEEGDPPALLIREDETRHDRAPDSREQFQGRTVHEDVEIEQAVFQCQGAECRQENRSLKHLPAISGYNVIAILYSHSHGTGTGPWQGISIFNLGSPCSPSYNPDGRGLYSVFRITEEKLSPSTRRETLRTPRRSSPRRTGPGS